jgi:hypothetical protein
MPPMEAIQYLAAFLICVGILIYKLPVGVCSKCDHCKAEVAAKAKAQEELAHNVQHRGAGYGAGTRDRYPCADETCSRNPKPPPTHECGHAKCPHSGEVH